MPRHIAVYCGSRNAVASKYYDVAREMGRLIATRGDVLVWGAGSVGLMGELARAVHEHKGRVVGVIPEAMRELEVCYEAADELIWTRGMRERKAIIDERSDVFIALPGGFGTLEELIEVVTHRQLVYHEKPVFIVNTDGFYDPMFALFEHFYSEGFARKEYASSYQIVPDPAGVYAALDRHASIPGT